MKTLKIFLILLVVYGCSNRKQIVEFEEILGQKNSETLNSMVSDFEISFLNKKYPNSSVKQAYKEYLSDIESNISGDWERPPENNIERFNKSELKEVIYGIPDSIWIIQSNYKSRTKYKVRIKYLDSKNEFQIGTLESSIPKVRNEDSLVKALKNNYYINYFGKYRKALYSVSDKNVFVKEYLKITQDVGTLDPRMVAYKMLIADLDFDNYFTKRMIITEIAYRL